MSVEEPSVVGDSRVRTPEPGPNGPSDPALTFPDVPCLELEQLLRRLVDRSGELMATQGRLCELLRANQAVMTNLTLPAVLRRICEAARELVDARYAALGVLGPDGSIAELVQVGMDEEAVRALDYHPQGKGLLAAVIDEGRPIRLRAMAEDPRASGIPPEHPPMQSFLGVPIRVRDENFGGLYLTQCRHGEFTAEDEELTRALAATAGVAIEKARLYESTRLRGEWLAATAAVTRETLDPYRGRPLSTIAERSLELTDADLALLLLPDEEGRLRIEIAVAGEGLEVGVEQLRDAEIPLVGSLAGHVFTSCQVLRLGDPGELAGLAPEEAADGLSIGPVLVVPLLGAERREGVLFLARHVGRRVFTEEDHRLTAGFANQAAIAMELAESRVERERVHVLDERERIAADLHDHVIQRLFAAGLSLQAMAARLLGPDATQLNHVIGDLDDTIAQIRTSIFALQQPDDDGVRSRVLMVVGEATRLLGFAPSLRLSGPSETLVAAGDDPSLADDVIAVLREALVNVAKHARASRVEVDLMAVTSDDEDRITLVVTDDGRGWPEPGHRCSGLANMERRARRRGGSFELTAHWPRGARIRWTVPLRRPAPTSADQR